MSRITFQGTGKNRVVVLDNNVVQTVSALAQNVGQYLIKNQGKEVTLYELHQNFGAWQASTVTHALMDFWRALATLGADAWLQPKQNGGLYIYNEKPLGEKPKTRDNELSEFVDAEKPPKRRRRVRPFDVPVLDRALIINNFRGDKRGQRAPYN